MLLLHFFFFFFFLKGERKKYLLNKFKETTFSDIGLFSFSSISFKKNHGFVKKKPPFRKNVLVKEELGCIDIDDIENLEDSPRL